MDKQKHASFLQARDKQGPRKPIKKQFIEKGQSAVKPWPGIDKGIASDGTRISLRAAPVGVRMAVRLNPVDVYIKRTRSDIPTSVLPKWDQWPLDSKIPDLRQAAWPEGSLYFTKGQIGERPYSRKKPFDLSDPRGYRKGVELLEYSALHDPHAKQYFQRKGVVPLLRKMKFIAPNNDVVCNAKDYNRFRSHLADIQKIEVHRQIKLKDDLRTLEIKAEKAYKQLQVRYNNSRSNAEKVRMVRIEQEIFEQFRHGIVGNEVKQWNHQLRRHERKKIAQRLEMHQAIKTKKIITKFQRDKKAVENLKHRRGLLAKAIFKTKRCEYNQSYDKMVTKVLQDRMDIDKLITMKKRDEQMLELKDIIDETVKQRKDKWIEKYYRHIKYQHENAKLIDLAKRDKEAHELAIQRSVFDHWREFVLRRRNIHNETNTTTFNLDKILDKTIKYLEELSGYDPSQTLFTNMINHTKRMNDMQVARRIKREALEAEAAISKDEDYD